jgi:hypothetical protein
MGQKASLAHFSIDFQLQLNPVVRERLVQPFSSIA